MKKTIAFIPLLVLLILAGLFINRLADPRISGTIDSPLIGKALPDIGVTIPGSPFIVNFFASWCTPCLIEHPHLMEMKKNGVKIIGVAFRDTPEAIDAFLKQHGNPYTTLIYDQGDGASITLGITGVPESFAVDINHIIRARQQGPLEDARAIGPFLKAMQP